MAFSLSQLKKIDSQTAELLESLSELNGLLDGVQENIESMNDVAERIHKANKLYKELIKEINE